MFDQKKKHKTYTLLEQSSRVYTLFIYLYTPKYITISHSQTYTPTKVIEIPHIQRIIFTILILPIYTSFLKW